MRKILVAVVLSLVSTAAVPGYAQRLSIGVIGGVNAGDDFVPGPDRTDVGGNPPLTVRLFNRTSSFTPKIGPKAEFALTKDWSVESAILFQQPLYTFRVTYDPPLVIYPTQPPVAEQVERYNEAIFEIPVLLKYRTPPWRRLVLELGPSFRPFGGFDGPGSVGVTAGAGLAFHAGSVRFQPTVRYTRWSSSGARFPTFRENNLSLLMNVDLPPENLRRGTQGSPLSAGFIGGTTLTKGFPEKGDFQGLTTRVVGVAFELHVTPNFGVEADVLYHPLILSERARATVVTWEIPFLAKYRFRSEGWRPFLAAGPAFRASGNRNATNPSIRGVVAGGGVEFRKARWAFGPTLRYVRWARDAPSENSPASTNSNQVQLLFVIRFPAD
ncbi:MAG: PorT family protein [Bryobacterales bacterium]|nr:PorT family protein [Bryobacterales bacterium]